MISVLASILLSTGPGSLPAVRADSAARRPLVALFVQGAFDWGGLAAGQAPIVVVYDDGTVLYCVHRTESEIRVDSVHLSSHELNAFLGTLNLDPDFFALQDQYNNLPNVTDMPVYTFRVWHGDTMKAVTLVGTLDSTFFAVRLTRADFAASTPVVLVRMFEVLCNYRHSRARRWRPSRFEAVVSDFPDAAEPPRPWPADWPTIEGPNVHQDAQGNYRVALSESQFRTFLKRYSRTVNERPFIMGGSNRFVRVRVVFPGEEAWVR